MTGKIIYRQLIYIACLLHGFPVVGNAQSAITMEPLYASRIWYDKPSVNWNEALPIGNGRMGAMIYGGVATEHIQLNEQTLWSGAPSAT